MDTSVVANQLAGQHLTAEHASVDIVQGDIRVPAESEYDLVIATSLLVVIRTRSWRRARPRNGES